jgi:hypothetical protein
MRGDALGARGSDRAIHRRDGEELVEAPPHGRLDDDRADALPDAPDARGADRRARRLGRVARPRGLDRHQRQPHDGCRAVARVREHVAVGVHEHAPREARAEPIERQQVGERAGREEHRALLAQQPRDQRFRGAHDVALAVLVGGRAGELRRCGQARRVFRGRGIVAVGVEVDHGPAGGSAPLRSTIIR